MLIAVEDPDDPRLADYLVIKDPARRRAGTFLAEGTSIVERALDAGMGLRSMLVCAGRESQVPPFAGPVYVTPPDVLARLAGFDVHRGVLAVVDRPPEYSAAGILAGAQRVLVVEGVNDTENLGSLFRSAAALGVDGVLVDPSCADPLYRRVVRVSMGASFLVPWARLAGWPAELRDELAGWRTVALTPAADVDLDDALRALPQVAILVGAEGPGLSPEALAAASQRVRIPMASGLDSLNVAVAAAVALWAARPDRNGRPGAAD